MSYIYYHVARIDGQSVPIKAGDTLKYYTYESFFKNSKGSSERKTMELFYPEGISWHGDAYLLTDSAKLNLGITKSDTNESIMMTDYNQLIDFVFELIRRAEFPDKPSRLQSMFSLATKKQAKNFIKKMGWSSSCPIWEIETKEEGYRVNMNLLNIDGRIIDIYDRARAYWNGDKGNDINPCWEILLKYPVKVIKNVN